MINSYQTIDIETSSFRLQEFERLVFSEDKLKLDSELRALSKNVVATHHSGAKESAKDEREARRLRSMPLFVRASLLLSDRRLMKRKATRLLLQKFPSDHCATAGHRATMPKAFRLRYLPSKVSSPIAVELVAISFTVVSEGRR